MAHTTRTLELSADWDLTLSDAGKIEVREGAIATAQNVANEARRFRNDTYFDFDLGIPHFEIELGHALPEVIFISALRRAALRVEDVAEILDIVVYDVDTNTRLLSGEIAFRTISGQEKRLVI